MIALILSAAGFANGVSNLIGAWYVTERNVQIEVLRSREILLSVSRQKGGGSDKIFQLDKDVFLKTCKIVTQLVWTFDARVVGWGLDRSWKNPV